VKTPTRQAVLDAPQSRAEVAIDQTSLLSELYQRLDSSPRGLNQEEATHRLNQYARNVLQKVQQKPLILKFLADFSHSLLLWVGGIVALIAGLPQLAIAIWFVNITNFL
jgi:magnesium-transporting ATPase (P-type)